MRRQPNENERLSGKGDDPLAFPETALRATGLLNEILAGLSRDDPMRRRLSFLRHQLEVDEQQSLEAQAAIAELQEIVGKLSSPANRIATYLGSPDPGIANIAIGDADYYSNVDARLDT